MTMRFLPWTRRGLAAQLTTVDSGGALPARATFPVKVTVNGGQAGTDIATYGPGDVTGIDLDAIVRSVPRRFATNVAPDEFAAIEFDPPDFPWMFTPAVAAGNNRLRPWLVLVVVSKVEGVSISVSRSSPLPVLTIEEPAVPEDELPDLDESWAWAHTQVLTAGGSTNVLDALAKAPDHNISRLLCPRRLRPGTDYYAALVPAFDAGVKAGLGQPAAGAQIQPAWVKPALGPTITLPLYYHWEFSTGPAGDFESLARRLQPMAVPDTVGRAPMFIGAAHPALPKLAPDAGGVISMEGALRAPEAGAGEQLGARHSDFVNQLTDMVNATSDAASTGTASDAEAVAPPVYGQWHVNIHQIPAKGKRPRWLHDLNTDPRHRAAAGIGAEVVRANQEEYVDAAWAQVGEVVAANELLDRARAMAAVMSRVHAKHIAGINAVAALGLTSAAHDRLPVDGAPLSAHIEASATPEGFTSRSFQRLASPRNMHLRHATQRVEADTTAAGNADLSSLTKAMSGALAPEQNVAPDGVRTSAFRAIVDSDAAGLSPEVRGRVREIADGFDALAARLEREPSTTFTPRDDLGRTGVLVDHHLAALRATTGPVGDLHERANLLRSAAAAPPQTPTAGPVVGFVLTEDAVAPATLDRSGTIVARVGDRTGAVATVETRELLTDGPRLARTALRLTKDSASARVPIIAEPIVEVGTRPIVRRPPDVIAPIDDVAGEIADSPKPVATIDTAILGAEAVTGFVESFKALDDASPHRAIPVAEPAPALDVEAIRDHIVEATNPRDLIVGRALARIQSDGRPLAEADGGAIELFQRSPIDPIMVGPVLDRALYRDLARFDQNRFLPGAGQIPDDAITLLETNPRFIEAFLVGVNHEFNRELLWRRYPSDRRGTAFRAFWEHLDGSDDIAPIHTWHPAKRLGTLSGGSEGGSITLLVRGQLLRRYPGTVIYAVRATADRCIDITAAPTAPIFAGSLDPDITFAGFDLDVTDVTAGHGTMFVLQEQPTEPRFGLDVPSGEAAGAVPAAWSALTWGHVNVGPGEFLSVGALTGSPTLPLAEDRATPQARFGADSAQMAAITFQRPFRVAIHSSEILD